MKDWKTYAILILAAWCAWLQFGSCLKRGESDVEVKGLRAEAADVYVAWNGRDRVPREQIEWSNLIFLSELGKDELPSVLVVGDSIVGNYGKPLAAALEGKANVVQLNGSRCVGDPVLLDELMAALSIRRYDVITVNNGLHGGGCTDVDYEKYLAEYVDFIRVKAPSAKIVLVKTTDVINEKPRTDGGDPWSVRVPRRNASMAKLADRLGLPVADLHSEIAAHPEYHQKDGVHVNPEGSQALAKILADEVLKVLPERTTPENAAFNAAHAQVFKGDMDGTWLLGYDRPENGPRLLTIGYEAQQKCGGIVKAAFGAYGSSFTTWSGVGAPCRSAMEKVLFGIERYRGIIVASVWKDFRPHDGEERLPEAAYAKRLGAYLDTVRAAQPQALLAWVVSNMSAKEALLPTLKRVCAEKGVRVIETEDEIKAFVKEAHDRKPRAANGPSERDKADEVVAP